MSFQQNRANQPCFVPLGLSIRLRDARDLLKNTELGEELYKVIARDAATHQAPFNETKFGDVLQAIEQNRIQAYFIELENKDSARTFGGGAIQYTTVITEWSGTEFSHYPALYREDIFVDPAMSEAFRHQTASRNCPKGVGLGAYLTHEEIRNAVMGLERDLPFGMTAKGLIGEYAPDNYPIVNALGKQGSELGSEQDSAVLYFPVGYLSGGRTQCEFIQVEHLVNPKSVNDIIQNVFGMTWKSEDESEQIAATFTEGFSTFNGEQVIRVQLTSNGFVPKDNALRNVLASFIELGQQEIERRNWYADQSQSLLPLMRFHALREPEIVFALRCLGAQTRLLGKHIMLPIVMDFQNFPKKMLNFAVPQAESLKVAQITESPTLANKARTRTANIFTCAA